MRIEIWSDYVCPFCYIGERKLEKAIKQLGIKDEVEIDFHSFELDPNATSHKDSSIDELIAAKYGMSVEEAKANNDNIVKAAQREGLAFNFEKIKPTNTFDAHRLSYYAKQEGKLKEYTEIVMKSYFIDSLLISDSKVLAELADSIGLNKQKALEILDSDTYSIDVRMDEQRAFDRKIQGVPYFFINEKISVYGAQSVDTFIEAMKDAK